MTLEQWLQRRSPEVPEAFVPFLQVGREKAVTVESLLEKGLDSLREALVDSEEARERAFPLLAADAWITYACEEAAAGEEFASVCQGIVEALGERFDP